MSKFFRRESLVVKLSTCIFEKDLKQFNRFLHKFSSRPCKKEEIKEIVTEVINNGLLDMLKLIQNGWFFYQYETPLLHLAVLSGDSGKLLYLLGKGLDPNVSDNYGNTTLFVACRPSPVNTVIIRNLLDNGADPKIKENELFKLLQNTNKYDVVKVIRNHRFPLESAKNQQFCLAEIYDRITKLEMAQERQSNKDFSMPEYGNLNYSVPSLTRRAEARDESMYYTIQETNNFLEHGDTPDRNITDCEQKHLLSKLPQVTRQLGDPDAIQEIADHMLSKEAMTLDKYNRLRTYETTKDKIRYLYIHVVCNGKMLSHFLAFTEALSNMRHYDSLVQELYRRNQTVSRGTEQFV